VEEGGGTRFSQLNLTVHPKPGRALMWPSVYDDDPSAVRRISDHRTSHEALEVRRGEKLAANMWLHQYDFQNTLAAGCKNEDAAECGDCAESPNEKSSRISHGM
jgi:prolyl 4-hydroxylase